MSIAALFQTRRETMETMVCPRCKQEHPKFRRGVIPSFVPAGDGDGYICMACKKAEPRVCPRCEQRRARFNEKGESNFYPVLKLPGEIIYICSVCRGAKGRDEKPRNGWA